MSKIEVGSFWTQVGKNKKVMRVKVDRIELDQEGERFVHFTSFSAKKPYPLVQHVDGFLRDFVPEGV
jgi:hypothetical protein